MLRDLIAWVGLLLLVGCAYCAPGYALLSLLGIRGIGRMGQVLLAIPVSLVIVPYVLVVVGSVFPLLPSFWMLAAFSLVLFAGAILRRHWTTEKWLGFLPRNAGAPSARPIEWIGVSAFILGFSALVGLPNLELFVHGDQALTSGTWDSFWHIAELTSVARSGIPPVHYFFPDSPLSYYYWSWIYPALLANQGLLRVPLERAYAIHVYVQVAAFLGLCYFFLRQNLSRPLGRLSGLGFLTIVGGFDIFAALGQAKGGSEWWQKSVPWLVSQNQISSFATIYMWVPQHLAGGLAFVLALLLWRNARGRAETRWAGLGILFAFTLGTSAFVFMASALAVLFWAVAYRKVLLSRRVILPLALALLLFGLGSWRQLTTTLGSGAAITWNTFRVPLVEKYLGIQTSKAVLADRVLTFLFFPIVGSWVLLIEIGLPFVLYVLYCLRGGRTRRGGWERFLIIFPALCFPLVCLFVDKSGADNLAMRGMIPAQIIIAVAAASYLDRLEVRGGTLAIRWGAAYLALLLVLSESATWIADLQILSKEPIGSALRIAKSVYFAGVNLASDPSWPNSLAYIHWINTHTPDSALIVEADPLPADDLRFRLMERVRFISPISVSGLKYGYSDLELLSAAEIKKVESNMRGKNTLEAALSSSYVKLRHPEIFYVAREQNQLRTGKVVYRDSYVTIYEIQPGMMAQ